MAQNICNSGKVLGGASGWTEWPASLYMPPGAPTTMSRSQEWPGHLATHRELWAHIVFIAPLLIFFFFSRGETPNNLFVFLSPDSHCPIWNLAYSAVEPSVWDIKTKFIRECFCLGQDRTAVWLGPQSQPTQALVTLDSPYPVGPTYLLGLQSSPETDGISCGALPCHREASLGICIVTWQLSLSGLALDMWGTHAQSGCYAQRTGSCCPSWLPDLCLVTFRSAAFPLSFGFMAWELHG